MNTNHTIMVQIGDREWTLEALHCACLLARNTAANIALIQMIPVQHLSWLGTEFGYLNITPQEQSYLAEYQTPIEDYGVEFTPLPFQYDSPVEAIVQAAEHVNAQIVFAKIPESIIPFWTRFQRWSLNRQLANQKCQWVQCPVYDRQPSRAIPEEAAEISGLVGHRTH